MTNDGAVQGSLRILMVAARYLPFAGGIETHVHEVGTRLSAAGHAVTVLTADPRGDLPVLEVQGGMTIERVRSFPSSRDWCLAPDLYRRVAKGGFDVVHVQGYHTFSAPLAMAGALRAGIPFILTFHSGGHSSRFRSAIRGLQAMVLGPLARRAAHLVGVSRYEVNRFSLAMNISPDRFSVVPNGASLPTSVSPVGELDIEAPIVVSLGRLERYKGHHRAIAAFAELRKRMPGAKLRILGEGPYEAQLRELIVDLGLASSVTISAVPPDRRADLSALLQSASLVVLLSDYEAHPVAVMEALSLGRSVLTAQGSGFDELADLGLVRSMPIDASPEAMARAMEAFIASPNAIDAKRDLPTWDGCADVHLSIYQRAVLKTNYSQVSSMPSRPVHFGRSDAR